MLPPIYSILHDANAVAAIVATRIYRHGRVAQDADRPYIAWFLAGVGPENNLSEPATHDRATVQIDCFHPQDRGVQELAEAVRAALEPHAHMTGLVFNGVDIDTKLYRIALQFDYWLERDVALSSG